MTQKNPVDSDKKNFLPAESLKDVHLQGKAALTSDLSSASCPDKSVASLDHGQPPLAPRHTRPLYTQSGIETCRSERDNVITMSDLEVALTNLHLPDDYRTRIMDATAAAMTERACAATERLQPRQAFKELEIAMQPFARSALPPTTPSPSPSHPSASGVGPRAAINSPTPRRLVGTSGKGKWTIRRDILAPFFARRAILKLESVIQAKIDKLISQLATYKDVPVNMHYAFRSATLDIIMEYLFANTLDALDAKDFRHPTLCGLQEGLPAFWLIKHFPWMFPIMLSIPPDIVTFLNPPARGILNVLRTCRVQIEKILADPESLDRAEHEIVYHHLMNPDPEKRGHEVASKNRLLDEAHTLLNAGSDTVGGTCTHGTFRVLNDPAILKRLRDELDSVRVDDDSSLNLEVLEKLPYLTAVIKESMRMTHGVVTPLPRIVGPDDDTIGGYYVPAGSIVAIGCTFLHMNEQIFPNPHKFDPERWLQPESKELEKYLVPFSTGPRQCLGINLAWAELYLIFGNLFSKLDLTIHNTTSDDFAYDEYFLPFYRGNQFHAYIKERRT